MTALPVLRGRDLTGRPRRLPGDLPEGRSLLLLGFAVGHQREIDRWAAQLPDVPWLEVPVAGVRDERAARWIEGGMLPGVPRALHARTVVVYTDRSALVRALGLPGPVPAAVVVDRRGQVAAVAPGSPSPASLATVRAALVPSEAPRA